MLNGLPIKPKTRFRVCAGRRTARRFEIWYQGLDNRVVGGNCKLHRVICAWCNSDLGPVSGVDNDSHGLCDACAAIHFQT